MSLCSVSFFFSIFSDSICDAGETNLPFDKKHVKSEDVIFTLFLMISVKLHSPHYSQSSGLALSRPGLCRTGLNRMVGKKAVVQNLET